MRSEEVFKRILVPADRSSPSINAQQQSVILGEKFGSEITVLHVVGAQFARERQLAYTEGKKVSLKLRLFSEKGTLPQE